jgi:hypothetical protein
MLAVKEKLLSRGTLANPSRLIKLYESVASNVQTDLTPWGIMKLAPLAADLGKDNITMHVLSNDADGELVNGNVNGAYMLFPRKQDWSEIRALAQNPLATPEQIKEEQKPARKVSVEIRNGTNIAGYASLMSRQLEQRGYAINEIGNAASRGYERTVIYDLTDGSLPDELAALKTLLHANVSPSLPAWAGTSTNGAGEQKLKSEEQTDFLIVLGESSYDLIGQ